MSARSVSWLNLFLALSLLVSSLVPAPRLVRARDLPPVPSGVEERLALPALDGPLPAPGSTALTDTSPLAAALSAAPEAVAPGDVVTFTLKLLNTGDASLNGLSASAALPEGLSWIPGQADWTFDAREKRVSATPDALPPGAEQTFSLQLRAAGPLDEAATLNVEVTQGEATLAVATASVWVAHPTQAQIAPQGGVLQASDGRVRVTFPAGAVDQPAIASYAARMQRPARGPAAALRFELNLHSTDDTPLPLSAPVTLTLQVGDLLDLQVRPDAWPYLAYLDEASGEWVRVPARADAQAGTLTAQVDHFSTWETGMDQQLNSGWRLTYNAPQVSTFSGAATFGYPIEVLPGRGGLQPSVTLSYNSRQVDGVLSWIQSDWAGLGWSIGGVEITRKVGREGSHNGYSNTFSLLMNGSSYKLIKDSNYPAAYGRYYTQPFSALRIERCNDLSTSSLCSDQPAPNTTGEYWIVRSPDGTTYKLGYTADAEQVVSDMFYWSGQYFHPNDPNEVGYAGRANDNVASRWRVNLVQDTFGNQMEYLYAEGNRVYYWDGASQLQYFTKAYDAASYLSEIRYNRRSTGGGDEYDRVVLERATRESVVNSQNIGDLSAGVVADANNALFWQTDYLKRIKVLRGNTLVRKYELSYYLLRPDLSYNGSAPPPHVIRLLKDVTQYGADGSSTLPLTSFGYALNEDATHKYGNKHACSNYCPSENEPWYRNHFPYYRLAWVNNGYGGQSEFTYTRDRSDAQNHERPYTYVVQEARTLDGMGHSARQSYSYSGGCWDRPGEACASWDGHHNWTLVGFQNVSESAYDYDDALLATVEHVFHTDSWAFAGRESNTYYRDAGQNLLRQVDQIWASETVTDSTFVYLDQSTSTVWQSGQAKSQRNVYQYNPADQGGQQYGNQTRTYQYDANNNLYRIQGQGFIPNVNKWIVNKPDRSYVADSDWNVLACNFYLYDEQTATGSGPGDYGKLTLTRALTERVDQPVSNGHEVDTVDTRLGYDAYGNPTSQTSYQNYGRIRYNATTSTWDNVQIGGGQEYETSTTYDSTYHLYPVQVCSPPVGSPPASHCSSTQYYGVDGVAADYGLPGQVKKVTDPNNVSTEYRYDTFGRVARIKAPDDAGWNDGQVTTRFGYSSLGQPGLQRVVTFRGRDALWEEVFFDGLGRTLQVHQKADGGQEVRTSTAYDGLGRTVETWIPYYGTHGENGGYGAYGYVPPAGGLPSTRTQYDALGRVTQVTQADGTLARMAYDGWRTATLDANDHQKISEVDAFGRLVKVREYGGTYSSPNWNASVYASTIYAYDRRDNLEQVTDAAGNVTTMSYDALGRKLTMNDPDMGAWDYAYNPAGSLTVQDDAKHQRTCFYYDALERLVGKYYTGDASACPTSPAYAASYSYDQGTNGVGRRTRMDDGSGYTTWSYDVRGRVTQERKVINGAGGGTFVTRWGYDPLDRVTWTKYPGGNAGQVGEQVSYAYNDQGLLDSVTGDDVYVGSTTYDAPGRVELRQLGAGVLRADYVYYPWTTANGLGRLQQLKTGTPSDLDSLQDLRYTYDAVGNVQTIKDYKVAGGTQTQSFGYDALDRLLSANVSGGSSGQRQYNQSYAYNGNAGKIGNLTSKTDVGTYYYQDASHKHAVTHINGTTSAYQRYWYDANGNQITRKVGSDTYDLSYDAENRLMRVDKNGVEVASFLYDGDGARVRAVMDDQATTYVDNHYEIALSPSPNGRHWSVEGSGDALMDTSGYGLQGEIHGAGWVSGGVSDQALDFDGVNDYVGFDAEPEITGEMTVSAWVRPEQTPTGLGRVVVGTYKWAGGGGNQRGWSLGYQYGSNDQFQFRVYSDAGNYALANLNGFFVTYLDQWVHVVGVYKPGQSVALYVNGEKVAEDTSAIPTAIGLSGLFKIGARADNTTQGHWDGQIDEVRVIGRALSQDEIESLLTVGVWKFDEGSGAQALDASGYGHHGEIQGAQWTAGGMSDQALDFDGVNDYVSFDAEPEIQDELTVSAWVRPEQAPTGLGRVVVGTYAWNGGGANNRGWVLGDVHGSSDHFEFRIYDDAGNSSIVILNGFFATYLNQWVHVAGVYKPGQSVALYVNGEKVAEDTTDIPTAIGLSGLFKIGARADNTTQGHWDGQIDEVHVVARALDQQEIQSLMQTGIEPNRLQPVYSLTVRKYYYAGNTRVALRENGELHYLLSDHLGSTAVTAHADGSKKAELRYEAWGETRYAWGDTPTTRRFTGQVEDDTIGLYFYNARYYDAALGRFVQADTIVPHPADPQSFNRYSYVRNNPLKYVDPSGHVEEWEDEAGGAALGKLKQCFGGTVTKPRPGTWLWRQTLRQQLGPWNLQWELNDYLAREFPQGDFYGRMYESAVYPTITTAPNTEAVRSSLASRANVGDVSRHTVAATESGVRTHSGHKWGPGQGFEDSSELVPRVMEQMEEIGHPIEPHGWDYRVEGDFLASHAEKQLSVAAPGAPMAISNPGGMCPDCVGYFQRLSLYQGPLAVADPNGVRVFNSGMTWFFTNAQLTYYLPTVIK